jgi:hypothetical protein
MVHRRRIILQVSIFYSRYRSRELTLTPDCHEGHPVLSSPFHRTCKPKGPNHLCLRRATLPPSLYRINLAAGKLTTSAVAAAGVTTVTAASLTSLLARLMRVNLAVGKFAGSDATVRLAVLAQTVVLWGERLVFHISERAEAWFMEMVMEKGAVRLAESGQLLRTCGLVVRHFCKMWSFDLGIRWLIVMFVK